MSSELPADPMSVRAVADDSIKPKSKYRQPPPEPPTDLHRRLWVVVSFWVVVLLLGIPLWWKLTTLNRVPLPIEDMLTWADGHACKPVFPLHISVRAPSIPANVAEILIANTQASLDKINDFAGHQLNLQLDSPSAPTPVFTIELTPSKGIGAKLDAHQPILSIKYPESAVGYPALEKYIAEELHAAFSEERSLLAYLTTGNKGQQDLSAELQEALDKRSTRSLQYASTYHLTFSLFTAGATPNNWDVDAAIKEYVQPMLQVLKPIHNFTVDTQVQLFATPGVSSPVLRKDELSSFINGAEWSLSPSIGEAPTINFIIYVGNQTIQIAEGSDETSQSWLIPKWGSVYLLPLSQDISHVSSADLKDAMLTFTGHLLSLIGTPQSGSLLLRLSTLSRVRSADLIAHASSSLGSLARLSQSLTSIAIPQTVADGVSKSLYHLERACATLGSIEALEHARIADAEAEKAFFEKSMVGQLYFPDEHKVAVYLPLLGPIGTALIMGLLTELKAWKKRRAEAKKLKEEKAQ